MGEFTLKNQRRRENFNGRDRAHREARIRRRRMGGAFGWLTEREYNRLVVGTSGAERKVRESDAVKDLEKMVGG